MSANIRLGALSLDYIGKFILMLIAVAIAIGLIIQLSNQPEPPEPPTGDNKFPKHVKIDTVSQQARIGKIASLIETCLSAMEDELESQTCYILTNQGGTFDISQQALKDSVPQNLHDSVIFRKDSYDGATMVISYDGKERKISVEE